MSAKPQEQGFTLIELSIVLVIIGLLVGGILVGKDLISSGGARGTISQLQSYQTAANAFMQKYNYLPGDMPDPGATNYGFASRGAYAGMGDGNGIIEGNSSNAPGTNGFSYFNQGETCLFWRDLSTEGLIPGGYPDCLPTNSTLSYMTTTLNSFMPPAKIGRHNHIYVWGSGKSNYLSIAAGLPGSTSVTGLTVKEAYDIDKKMDDGLPQSGNVQAFYVQGAQVWYSGQTTGGSSTTATPGSSTTCFDNGNNSGSPQQYSLAQNTGKSTNCALSFAISTGN